MSPSTQLPPRRGATDGAPLVLALDAGSEVTSVALARGEVVLAERVWPAAPRAGAVTPKARSTIGALSSGSACDAERPSLNLIGLIDTVLDAAGVEPRALDAVCALRGPGSFTGLRIALATALGLRQALGVPAGAIATLRAIAEAAGAERVLAVVDALRGEWFAQPYARRAPAATVARGPTGDLEAEAPARLVRAESLRESPPAVLAGFGADRLAREAGLTNVRIVAPASLASVAARHAHRLADWEPRALTEPLYLRPAPTTPPRSPIPSRPRSGRQAPR